MVAIRCTSAETPDDKDAFYMAAEDAFGYVLDLQLFSRLLRAYKALGFPGEQGQAFPSNSQIAAMRRSGPRRNHVDDDGINDF